MEPDQRSVFLSSAEIKYQSTFSHSLDTQLKHVHYVGIIHSELWPHSLTLVAWRHMGLEEPSLIHVTQVLLNFKTKEN